MRISFKHFALLITSLIVVSGCSASADNENQSANSTSSTSAPIPPEPTSLQDLVENSDAAAYWAWKKSSEKVLNSSPTAKKAIVEIGPNTTPDYLSPQIAIDLASKLYSDHKQNQELTFVYYEHEDTAWAQKKLNDFLGKHILDWQKEQAQNSCRAKNDCLGAVAITHPKKPAGIVLVSASDAGKKDANHTSGTLEAHEYTHIIQDESQGRFLGQVPRWQAEGEAMFAQAASIYHLDFQSYTVERERIIKELIKNPEISQSWLIDFINPGKGLTRWEVWDKYPGWRVYDVGMLVTEVLASLKGPESTMRLSLEVGSGLSYQKAFEKIYGIPWETAVPLLAQIIYNQINS
jgi:hypothetical protein